MAPGAEHSGLEKWEEHQVRHHSLDLRRSLGAVEELDEEQPWEENLEEEWEDMQLRLERILRSNSLDHEQKPFSEKTKGVVVTDGRTADGKPQNILWQAGPKLEDENVKQNSDHLLAALRLWSLELPNM